MPETSPTRKTLRGRFVEFLLSSRTPEWAASHPILALAAATFGIWGASTAFGHGELFLSRAMSPPWSGLVLVGAFVIRGAMEVGIASSFFRSSRTEVLGLTRPRLRDLLVWPMVSLCTLTAIFLGGALLVGHAAFDLSRSFQPEIRSSAAVVGGVLIAPIFEEILFRGLILQFLRSHFGSKTSIALSSVAFALAHGSPFSWPGVFVGGVINANARIRSDSLIVAILCHSAWNALYLAVMFSAPPPG